MRIAGRSMMLLSLFTAGCWSSVVAESPLEAAVSKQLSANYDFEQGGMQPISLPDFIPIGTDIEVAHQVLEENGFRRQKRETKSGKSYDYHRSRYGGGFVTWHTDVTLRCKDNKVVEVMARGIGDGF